MSYWGTGTSNNLIDWGQGAINNNINWGSVYAVSWSGDTDIIGIVPAVIIPFEARVLADGGAFEAKQCLSNSLTELNNIQ